MSQSLALVLPGSNQIGSRRDQLVCQLGGLYGESEQITDGFHLTASLSVLRNLLESTPERLGHTRARLLLGYAGWGPGQLDNELADSAWLTAPADPTIVFETPAEMMWETVIRSLGIEPMSLAPAPGVQ